MGLPTVARAADDGLVPPASDLPGFKAAASGAKVGVSAAGGRTVKALKGAKVVGAAYRAKRQQLSFGVFTTSSSSRAASALAQLGDGARTLKLGDGARVRTTSSRKSATAIILVRVGTALGAVRMSVTGAGEAAAASTFGRAHAGALVTRLRRVLALSGWDRTLDGVKADGSVTPTLALQLFALAHGPLPGVRTPAGPRGPPQDGTLATLYVAQQWDKLSAAQHDAIDKALGAPHDSSSKPVARAADQVLTPDAGYQALSDKYAGYYTSHLPGAPTITSKVYKASEDIEVKGGGVEYADAAPLNAFGEWGEGIPVYCRIEVPPEGQKQDPEFRELIIAHETFHCFQFKLMTAWRDRPAWIIEGMADWAAITSDPVPVKIGGGPYKQFLKEPSTPLFGRSYDGTAFWARADELGGINSLWSKIPAILSAPDDPTSAALAGIAQPGFLDVWAAAARRYPAAGSVWYEQRPYALTSKDYPSAITQVTGDASLAANEYGLGESVVVADPTQSLVAVLRTDGGLRAGTRTADYGQIGFKWFCFGTCKCPPGKVSAIPEHQDVPGSVLALALTGGATGGDVHVSYHSVDEFCFKKPPSPDKPRGPAQSNGDPHMTTLDGLHYDFQAAGEFTLVRSKSGDLEIQARQVSWAKSRVVTVNTQFGMRVAGHRVTVSPGAGDEDPPVVRVDGTVQAIPPGPVVTLAPGATVSRERDSGTVDIVWPDGSNAQVRSVRSFGVSGEFALAAGRRGAVSGLLGDFDGSAANDLTGRDGRRVAFTALPRTADWGGPGFAVKKEFSSSFFDALYGDYADSWRIKQGASLLDYGPGQSTKTFTDRSIPTRPVAPEDVAAKKRAAAETICRDRGVTLPGPLAQCITDVAATGNAAFADDAYYAQQASQATFRRLDGGVDRTQPLDLLETPDGLLHIGFEEHTPATAAFRMVDLPVDAAGRGGPEETIDGIDSVPILFAGPDGGARVEAPEIPDGAPSGIYQYARGAGGAWSPLGAVTTDTATYVGRPEGMYLPDGTLVSLSPTSGTARLYRNTGVGNPGTSPQPNTDCVSTAPALARDGANGAMWVAWVQSDCPQSGVFAQQFDPATLAPIGSAIAAPGTLGGADAKNIPPNADRLAFTGRPGAAGVFLAYTDPARKTTKLWRVGDPAAVSVPARQGSVSYVRLVADPSGGALWLGWTEDRRLWLQRTTAAGAPSGDPRPLDPPPDAPLRTFATFPWEIAARAGGVLDVVYGLTRDGDAPGMLWNARVAP